MKHHRKYFFRSAPFLLLAFLIAGEKAEAADLRLSWADGSNNESGFKIERKAGSGAYSQIAVTGANVTSYTDSNLAAGTVYCYQVRAYNAAGNSGYSNAVCATTAALPPPPPPPPPAPPPAPPPGSMPFEPAKIGTFRASTAQWFIDLNGSGGWNGCDVDECLKQLGNPGDLPVVGSWSGGAKTLLGVFDPDTATWYLDLNGNGLLDGCETTTCRYVFGKVGDLPVTGDWNGKGKTKIGVFRPSTGKWYLDLNGNGKLDACTVDKCVTFGKAGDLPVTGDWTGSGKTELGVFRPSTGQWFLRTSSPTKLRGCTNSPCVYNFGAEGDLPVVGDWSGSGTDKIGVFQPDTSIKWFLDFNGNGVWEGCSVDECFGPFGGPDDLPVVVQR